MIDRPFAPRARRLALLAAAAVFAAAPALAQNAPAAAPKPPAPKPAAPAPAPAQAPAQPAPQAGAPAAAAGPSVVQAKAAPEQPDWVKVCGKDQAQNKEICYTTRDFVTDQGQPLLAVAIYDVKGEGGQKIVRFLLPLTFLLQPGVRFAIDQGPATAGRYAICLPNGCFAEAPVNDAFIAAMKKGTSLNISVQNQMAKEVTFQVPVAGFAKGFDGPPIDPAVLEQQQKQLQEQMQKQAEEMRKRMDPAAGGAAAGAPAAGGAAAPAPKP
jgi:invasion protein IalB